MDPGVRPRPLYEPRPPPPKRWLRAAIMTMKKIDVATVEAARGSQRSRGSGRLTVRGQPQ